MEHLICQLQVNRAGNIYRTTVSTEVLDVFKYEYEQLDVSFYATMTLANLHLEVGCIKHM